MSKRKNPFCGGMRFAPFEGQPSGPVEQAALPSNVLIPLQQGCDGPVQSQVEAGERVSRGQVLGLDPAGRHAPVHSSVSGTVKRVGRISETGPEVVSIAVDASGEPVAGNPIGADFGRRAAAEVADALFEAGVVSMTRDGIPVPRNPRGIDPDSIDILVVAALDTGVLAVSPEALVGDRLNELAIGIRVMAHALGVGQTWMAVDEESADFAAGLAKALAGDSSFEIRPLPRVYPQHWDEMLTPVLTQREVPDSGRSCDVGVVCVDIPVALAAYDAVVTGIPAINHVLVLGGPGYQRPGLVRAPLGMPVEDLVRPRLRPDMDVRLVEGGLLSGRAMDPAKRVVTRELRRIDAIREDRERKLLAFLRPGRDLHSYGRSYLSHWRAAEPLRCDSNLHGEERACINCGACNEVCPRELLPYWLSKQVRAGKAGEAVEFGLNACIECGLCSYVCPSKIPLMEEIQRGKERAAKEQDHA